MSPLRRIGTVCAASLAAVLASPAVAFATHTANETANSHTLGVVNTLLIFVGAPAAVFALVAGLTMRPSAAPGAQRYRPGRTWHAAPVWVGEAPVDADTAQADPQRTGGASGSW